MRVTRIVDTQPAAELRLTELPLGIFMELDKLQSVILRSTVLSRTPTGGILQRM